MGQSWDAIGEIVRLVDALGVPAPVVSAIELLLQQHVDPQRGHRVVAVSRHETDRRQTLPTPKDVSAVAELFHRRALKRVDLLGDLASDLAWQMLLALTAEDGKGRGIPVTSLCIASGGPATTALRHIAAMEKHGLIQRFSDPKDGRRAWLHLTDETRERMHALLIDFCIPPPASREPVRAAVFADPSR